MKVRRSMLLVPASVPSFVERSVELPADCVLFDMQDAVTKTDEAKLEARATVVRVLQKGGFKARETVARMNNPGGPWFEDDVSELVRAGLDSVMLTRAYGLADIQRTEELILAAAGGRPVDIQIEVDLPSCLIELPEIAKQAKLVTALWLGPGDFGLEIRSSTVPFGVTDSNALDYYRGQIVTYARAMGWNCGGDLGFGNPEDPESVRAAMWRARAWGFEGTILMSPRHLDIVHEVFGVPPEERAWAEDLIARWEEQDEGPERNRGMRKINGRNVVTPGYEQARRVLRYAAVLDGDPAAIARYAAHGLASDEYIRERPDRRAAK